MEILQSIAQAVISGNKEKVVEFIKTNPSAVNEFSEDGWTLLHLAAYFGQKASEFSFRKWCRYTY